MTAGTILMDITAGSFWIVLRWKALLFAFSTFCFVLIIFFVSFFSFHFSESLLIYCRIVLQALFSHNTHLIVPG